MATKTAAPSGLTITRKALKFVCAWKIVSADHGAGQEFQYKTNLMKNWKSAPVTKKATEKTVALTASYYFPNTSKKLESFSFRVRGKREDTDKATYDWSAWTVKTFAVKVPNRPALTATLDSTLDNKSTFEWETETSTDDSRPFTSVLYQTILVRACKETDGSKLTWKSTALGWGTGTGTANSSMSRTEDTSLLAVDSYTRWVRVKSRGPGGESAWRYAKHVYAKPNAAIIKAAAVENVGANTTTVKMSWTLAASADRPVDEVQVRYLIDTPASGRAAPSGGSWTTAATIADTSGTDSARFTIAGLVGPDECLWVQVRAIHDHSTNYTDSEPRLVSGGRLTAPSGLTVSANGTTGMATISATNNSDVPDSALAVVFRKKGQADYVCGVITGTSAIEVKCAPWGSESVSFGVYAFQGTYALASKSGEPTRYSIKANMLSDSVWDGGTVPVAPGDVTVSVEEEGEVAIAWKWSWADANRAEVSWSKNPHAWESTEAPQTYLIESINASQIRIPNLETGATWYFRVRLAQETSDGIVYGPYCDPLSVNLATAPATPGLALSAAVVAPGADFAAAWSYESTDGTGQGFAEIKLATVSGDTVTPGDTVLTTETAKSGTINATALGNAGATYYLIVRVSSISGLQSDWSDPVPISVAAPITCTFSATSLTTETIEDDDETTRTETVLTEMPLTATVTGAGAGGTTTLSIERAEAYQMDRPDDSVFNGFDGETIFTTSQLGEDEIEITTDELIGHLDDGARYKLVATATDGFGQTAAAEIPFLVRWSHQAVMPSATAEIDDDNLIAVITPIAPTGAGEGDVCDIYRLSADKPELIVQGGEWGTEYVDPYPAIGEFGGHRVVCRTANGDYITEDNQPAWVDLGEEDDDRLDVPFAILDCNGDQIRLPYNLKLSSAWKKDFQETQYLGGAIQGDWNPAVSRTGSIETVTINIRDPETVLALRRLAVHPGICHVRTPDGSSFSADVQVSESRENGVLASFTLTITRVDPEGLDGLTYAEWEAS